MQRGGWNIPSRARVPLGRITVPRRSGLPKSLPRDAPHDSISECSVDQARHHRPPSPRRVATAATPAGVDQSDAELAGQHGHHISGQMVPLDGDPKSAT
jgi:hypothetical protein